MKFFIVVGSAITRLVSVRGGPNMVLNLVLVVMCKHRKHHKHCYKSNDFVA